MNTLKIIFITFLAIVLILFISCSSSNNGGSTGSDLRIIFLLDQSISMADDVSWTTGHTCWDEVHDELEYLFNNLGDGSFYFGLDAFPDGTLEYFEACHDECCADPACFAQNMVYCISLASMCTRGCSVDLPPIVSLSEKSTSGPEIISYMNLSYLPGTFTSTPLVAQMQYYNQDLSEDMPGFYSGDGNSYLVVISDGEDTCDESSENIPAIVAELSGITSSINTNYGIKTIAVGFSDTSGNTADELNAIAANGGTEYTTFFPITESGSLRTALNTIQTDLSKNARKTTKKYRYVSVDRAGKRIIKIMTHFGTRTT
jgi:hypothetical protein